MEFEIPSEEKNIAVALSGGGDSMALAHMMCTWGSLNGRTIHLLTVNHNLRPDSAREAEWVRQCVINFPNSIHHILLWDFDVKPDMAIMEKAREARYDLMTAYCQHHNIKTLAIAHHANDQLETFLFRLAKGSGLDGLAGMEEWRTRDTIRLYRPLLQMGHDDLIEYCRHHNLEWIEDPTNINENYARPRLRQTLAQEGLDTKRFAKTLERLRRGRQALDDIAENVYNDAQLPNGYNWKKITRQPLDIQIRVLQKLLIHYGGTTRPYPPKLERVEDIVTGLKAGQSATLYGCILSLSKDGNTLEIKRTTA
tara:strand:- start:1320 stop:2249 length:930 start_codon:yes stop_codon:yes gene_type:complete